MESEEARANAAGPYPTVREIKCIAHVKSKLFVLLGRELLMETTQLTWTAPVYDISRPPKLGNTSKLAPGKSPYNFARFSRWYVCSLISWYTTSWKNLGVLTVR